MTEAEWLVCDSPLQLFHELGGRMSSRKFRLMLCDWLRRKEFPDARSSAAVTVAERFADGDATVEELARAREAARLAHEGLRAAGDRRASFLAGSVVSVAGPLGPERFGQHRWNSALTRAAQRNISLPPDPEHCARIRDIFGNPFRPITFSPSWRTDTTLSLANQMYELRDFGAMPILADALQDAGCDCDDTLGHCRGDGPHARGCWVVDLVLGKA